MTEHPQRPDEPEDHMAVVRERRHLVNVAYRLLGSLTEAEDAVQETYSRWYAMSAEQQREIQSPVAWLTTVTSRVCLDVLKSARVRREQYVGEWVPEPLPSATTADPGDRVTLDESVNMALLVVLEAMTPAERVAFILHDVFHYPFEEIGRIVGRSSAACRQLASSARKRVDGSSGIATPSLDQARLVTAFARAWEAQDVRALVDLLDPDATVVADGGGLVNAARRPIRGADRLARFLAQLGRKGEALGVELAEATVNGAARAHRPDGRRDSARAGVRREQGRIRNLWAMVNPEKLRPWNQPI